MMLCCGENNCCGAISDRSLLDVLLLLFWDNRSPKVLLFFDNIPYGNTSWDNNLNSPWDSIRCGLKFWHVSDPENVNM